MPKNIAKLYIANFLTGFVFWYPIEKLFMGSIGISPFGIVVNGIVIVIVSMTCNIPAGILADRWSRKYTLLLGIAALAISSLLMGYSSSLLPYLGASAVWGLYVVLTSGTYQAIAYDSLAQFGRTDEYVKHQGRSYGMFLIGVSLSSVLGGYLAHHFGYRASYLFSAVPCLINIAVIASMQEPKFHKEIEDPRLWQHLTSTIRLVSGQKLLLYLSLLFVGVSVMNSTQSEYAGLYYIALGFGAIGNGWANAAKWLFSSLGQFLSNRLGAYTRMLVPIFFIAFMAFSVVGSAFGLLFFFLATFVQSIIATNIEGVIQQHTPSHIRATTISLLGFLECLILIPVSLVFGYLARHSIFSAYAFVGVIGIIFWLAWLLRPASVKQQKLYTMKAGHPSEALQG